MRSHELAITRPALNRSTIKELTAVNTLTKYFYLLTLANPRGSTNFEFLAMTCGSYLRGGM